MAMDLTEQSKHDNIEELYNKYNILVDAGDEIGKHEDAFAYILAGVKGTSNEKRLSSQFIAKFVKHFPTFYERAVDALFDLCEDEDTIIRKQAIKDLPMICKDCKQLVPKITDVLAQLLLVQDSGELQIINSSLLTLCKIEPKGFLSGLFSQIECGEDITREKVIKFMGSKMKTLPDDLLTKEVEEYFLQEARKVMQDCTKDEFLTFMNLLSTMKISKTVSGHQILIDIITEQAELENPFETQDIESVDKVLMCIKQAASYFSPFVHSNAYMQYICTQIIPVLKKIGEAFAAEMPGVELQILQTVAEISPYVQPSNSSAPINLDECLNVIFSKLLEYMPLPPVEEAAGDAAVDKEPTLELSHVESVMYTFHQLVRHKPAFLATSNESGAGDDRFKDLKLRLQYLARGVQNYIKKLKESLSTVKKSDDLKSEENKLKFVALKTTSNINALIKDLFKNPPSFKTAITLSWKPVKRAAPSLPVAPTAVTITTESSQPVAAAAAGEQLNDTSNANKRKAITAPEGSKPKKELRQFYSPPSGKFSSNIRNTYKPQFRGGRSGFNRGGASFRGSQRGRGQRGRGFRQRFTY